MSKDREPIWIALSDFYVDNELSKTELDYIGDTFRESPYSLQEIRAIDRYEVFPLLQQNRLSVAGVWTGFKPEWVVEECAIREKKRKSWWYRMYCNFYYSLFGGTHKQLWKDIEYRLRQKQIEP